VQTSYTVMKIVLFVTYAFAVLIHLEIGQEFKNYNPIFVKNPRPIESTSSSCPVLPHIAFELHDQF